MCNLDNDRQADIMQVKETDTGHFVSLLYLSDFHDGISFFSQPPLSDYFRI